jgi:hypothetical protein
MARGKKPKKTTARAKERDRNLPTPERMRHGRVVIRSNIAHAEDPLRIDRLLRNGIIDEMQHLYGMQIITLWTISSRPFLKASQYEPRHLMRLPDFAAVNLSRMTAEDQFYKAMSFLRPRARELICRICFMEQGAIEAGRGMGLPVNSVTVYVREAFDALGDALAKMRELKRAIEKPEEEKISETEPT